MSELPSVEFDETAVVVVGVFNPAIISPAWLRDQGLIGDLSGDDAEEVGLISPDLTNLELGSLQVNVLRERLQIQTLEIGETERVRDLAVGILRTLRHTPVGALGINRSIHVPTSEYAEYHRLGDRIIPKHFWESVVNLPGMRSSTIWGTRPDLYEGRIQITVEPSSRIPQGIFIHYNDHFMPTKLDRPIASRDDHTFMGQKLQVEPKSGHMDAIIEILEKEWESSIDRAHIAFQQIWAFATEAEE